MKCIFAYITCLISYYLTIFEVHLTFGMLLTWIPLKSDYFHSESENCKFQMYRFNAEDPGQFLYTPTTVGVIHNNSYPQLLFLMYISSMLCPITWQYGHHLDLSGSLRCNTHHGHYQCSKNLFNPPAGVLYSEIINRRCACAARVMVVVLCVCLLVGNSLQKRLFVLKMLSHTQRAT